jgi:pyridoxal phosphate enzyme (YggS family)
VVTPKDVAANLAEIHRRIERAGGDPHRIVVVAVSKTFPVSAVEAAYEAGLRVFGENYAAELLAKAEALSLPGLAWHFLGAIQTNKVARLAEVTACYESVSRVKEAAEIARRAPGASIMVQVDLTGLAGRSGAAPEDVGELVDHARSLGLDVQGLMTVAPQEPEAARGAFRVVRSLADELGLAERSMGMTDDLELAVAEGSTMLRIGRALFGPRATQMRPSSSET